MNWSAGFLNIEPYVVQGMQINIAISASITKNTLTLGHSPTLFFSNFIPSDAKKAMKHIKLHTMNMCNWFGDASTACFLSGLAVPCRAREFCRTQALAVCVFSRVCVHLVQPRSIFSASDWSHNKVHSNNSSSLLIDYSPAECFISRCC